MDEMTNRKGGTAGTRTLGELASALGARLLRGDADQPIQDIATLENAGPESISFIAGEAAAKRAAGSRAGAFVAPSPLDVPDRAVLRIEGNPWPVVKALLDLFRPTPPVAVGVAPSAKVGKGAHLGAGVALGDFAVVEDDAVIGSGTAIGAGAYIGAGARLGENCVIHPGVRLLHDVRIGDRVIIHSGAVLGADGYKFEYVDNKFLKIPQVGTVIIEDDVEIGANTCIDRAFLDATRVGAGTKIDNLVHIAHNVRIGRHCLIIAQVGIAGSSVIEDGCILAGQVGVKDNITVGAGARVGAQSGITRNLPPGSEVFGTPCLPLVEELRNKAALKRLPEALKELAELKRAVEELKGKPGGDSEG